MRREDLRQFEWDVANIDKSYRKHGITPNETEEVFLDEQIQVVPDIQHSQAEPRHIALGKTVSGKLFLVVFTVRKKKVRVISARPANRKERRVYEKKD